MNFDSGYYLSAIHLLMQGMFVMWLVLVVRIVRRTIAAGSIGLPAALVLAMSFLYGGCFVYAVPGYTHLRFDGHWYLIQYGFTEWMVVKATFASLLGLAGFALGCGVFSRRPGAQPRPAIPMPRSYGRRMLTLLGAIGLASFGFHYLRVSFPMSHALIEAGRNVGVAAICLGAYLAHRDGKSRLVWFGIASLIPAYYLVGFGFVSYGFLFGVLLTGFWMAQLRQRSARSSMRDAVITLAVVYFILTAFVGWMTFRDEVRQAVWSSGAVSVLEILVRAARETEIFSIWNFNTLDQVNIRLNLPLFIGRMIEQHEIHPDLRQYGATLVILPLVILPRFLWPDKPARGGSEFMEEHTGIFLSDSATFGTGTVFELFINFGYLGVFLGFVFLGWFIGRLDRMAARHLRNGKLIDFARLYVVGIVAVDPLLRPFFIVNGAVFAWIIMTALKLFIGRFASPTIRHHHLAHLQPKHQLNRN